MVISNNDETDEAGYVAIYEYTGGTWQQRGSVINDTNINRRATELDCAINADGSVVVLGDKTQTSAGEVYVYEWDGSNWTQKGNTVTRSGTTRWGVRVNVSADGNVFTTSSTTSPLLRVCI